MIVKFLRQSPDLRQVRRNNLFFICAVFAILSADGIR